MVLRFRDRGRVGRRRHPLVSLATAKPNQNPSPYRLGFCVSAPSVRKMPDPNAIFHHLMLTNTRAGIVTVAGRPNAGKSTLLNRLVGERLAITSAKPQSTRDRVVGIISDETTQIVLLDTPGLLEPKYDLHKVMRSTSRKALRDADLILYLIDTKSQAFAIYRVEPSSNPRGSGSVKLEAARKYRWDLMLSEYNNLPPEVRAVESMVKPSSGNPHN